MTFKTSLPLAILLLVLALIPVSASAQIDFDRIIFFGDSLSDPGNAFVLSGEVSTRPFDPIPSAPYARGGKHFSNGATWTEVLAKTLKMNNSGKAAFVAPGEFTNYAVGGSRARLEGDINLSVQVALFAQDFPVAPSDALYSIVIGGNDLRDAIEAFATDPTGATSAAIIEEAIASIAGTIAGLAAMGAGQFLVGNAPDLGLTPAIRALGPDAQVLATALTVGFNDGLAATLDALELGLGVTIVRIDIFQLITEMVADPGAFGLEEAIDACLTFYVRAGAFCNQPDDYLFWDGIHPTKATHKIVAGVAVEALD